MNAIDHGSGFACMAEEHVDLEQLVAIEQLLRDGDMHVRGVVDVEPEHPAFRSHQADNLQAPAADAHVFAEGVAVAEQLALQRRPEHGDRLAAP